MNSEMLSIPVLPTTGGQKSYEYRATSVWNEWQLALKLSESVTSLSFILRDYLHLKRNAIGIFACGCVLPRWDSMFWKST